MDKSVSGTEPGQRQLNGPQTTGREYRNLSKPHYAIARGLVAVRRDRHREPAADADRVRKIGGVAATPSTRYELDGGRRAGVKLGRPSRLREAVLEEDIPQWTGDRRSTDSTN
jgi:hypothetical protein